MVARPRGDDADTLPVPPRKVIESRIRELMAVVTHAPCEDITQDSWLLVDFFEHIVRKVLQLARTLPRFDRRSVAHRFDAIIHDRISGPLYEKNISILESDILLHHTIETAIVTRNIGLALADTKDEWTSSLRTEYDSR